MFPFCILHQLFETFRGYRICCMHRYGTVNSHSTEWPGLSGPLYPYRTSGYSSVHIECALKGLDKLRQNAVNPVGFAHAKVIPVPGASSLSHVLCQGASNPRIIVL